MQSLSSMYLIFTLVVMESGDIFVSWISAPGIEPSAPDD